MAVFGTAPKQILDLKKRNPILDPLIKKMNTKLVGQGEMAIILIDIVARHLSGFSAPSRPAGNALILGPTGSGKTYAVETLCEGLYGDPKHMIKIDCAEFQHSHEIAKLVGSPPGYLGHRETPPLLTQERINGLKKEGMPLVVILFDEIEKASDALWQLLLGILDKATLTLGDNRAVNFEECIILLTSNLGAKQMQMKRYGFVTSDLEYTVNDMQLSEIAVNAAKKHFTAEFMNRLDYLIVSKILTREQTAEVMEIELGIVQQLFWTKAKFLYQLTQTAKDTILNEGYSKEYGARNLKRVIERRLRLPLASIVSSGQITPGNTVVIDQVRPTDEQFEFSIQKLVSTNTTFEDIDNIL
jgi:ATP-dependent Clp protease ATP-binding subunit ClpB